ncbi:hypothetical protein LTV02_17560 [Nocardia yamanashiensis]|uniref:hypothetical protein n=1 Tax=Nocardia yamanashiensis TaxID=209247 RepID=UPI001E4D13F7|nr:hypothetical protein [Nocardia yamanashiensis]UGT45081.1 hypothetical protein LTV02_17560 [Nocardia yamanashiensis]
MSSRRPEFSKARRVPLLAAAVAAVALTAACGGNSTDNTGSSQPQGSSTTAPGSSSGKPTTSGGATSKPNGGQVTVSDEAAKSLCDLLRPQLSDWRVQGPTLGKIALNATAHEWALKNGGINIQMLGDKDVLDRVTQANCSDVRDQALSALQIQSLAQGVIG